MDRLSFLELERVQTQHWIWAAVGVIAVLAGAFLYWQKRRRNRSRLIAFVGLLREPVTFDSAIVARLAGKVWNCDLGDGTSEGADGIVGSTQISSFIIHGERRFLVNTFPRPYMDDPEEVAKLIADKRISALFCEHRAWFSCDALGVDHSTSADEIGDWYRRLGKLFAELLDENCLLVLVPDIDRAYPINEDTETALRADDPLAALQETLTVPIIEVATDDPLMKEAVEKARQEWPRFVAAYEARAGENFSIKAPVTHGENTEFIWIAVTTIEGERVYGELGNEPGNLGSLKLGSKVSVLVADLNDWAYLDKAGKMTGGFTIEAVQKAARRRRAK